MDPNALSDAVAADRVQGRLPVLIAATAGTTNAGMIDPLADCAEIARICGVWYHFDAAWGGALIAFDRLRGVLAGFGRADSLTIDAHKWFATMMGCWFATMMGCGMFITRHAQVCDIGSVVAPLTLIVRVSGLNQLHAVQYSQSRPV